MIRAIETKKKIISEIISKNQDKVEEYKSGKEKLFVFFWIQYVNLIAQHFSLN